jgi:probable HAF family extracellular repeat protein
MVAINEPGTGVSRLFGATERGRHSQHCGGIQGTKATAINARGQIVGLTPTACFHTRSFGIGVITDLGTLPGAVYKSELRAQSTSEVRRRLISSPPWRLCLTERRSRRQECLFPHSHGPL